MKSEDGFSRAFIDLARMGRTDWRSVVLTVLLLKLLAIVFGTIGLLAVVSPTFFDPPLFRIADADKTLVFRLADAAACVFGIWLACKKILRRPFRSLISMDMTFDIRRCLLGAALYLPAMAISFMAITLFISMRTGAWLIPFPRFEWPHEHNQIVASIGTLVAIPFLAFTEEVLFRGWLTQTLARYIRFTIIIVAVVAVLFASAHTQYDWRLKMVIFLDSFGFSALSLRDQRLELAIGAHSMANICVTLQLLFLTGPIGYAQIPATTLDLGIIFILKNTFPYVLMYGLLQKTGGWFVPTDDHPANQGDVLATPL